MVTFKVESSKILKSSDNDFTFKSDLGLTESVLPIAHWKMNDDATDSIGTYDGTVVGATYGTGKINNAVSMDGVDDTFTTDGVNGLADGFTIVFWAKTNKTELASHTKQAADNPGTTGVIIGTDIQGRQGIDTEGGTLIDCVIPNTFYGSITTAVYGYQDNQEVVAGTYEIIDNDTEEVVGSGNLTKASISTSDKRLTPYLYAGGGRSLRYKVYFSDTTDLRITHVSHDDSGYDVLVQKRQSNSKIEIGYTGNGYRVWLNGISTVSNAYPITPNDWQHIIVTYDNINVKIYLDNVLKKTSAYSNPIIDSTDTFRIGCSLETVRTFWGLIDDVRVYDYVLNESQRGELYHYGAGTENHNISRIRMNMKMDNNSKILKVNNSRITLREVT